MSGRLYLVTGGGGFIGSHLVKALLRRGDRVRVFDNFSSGRRENLSAVADQIELIEADVNDAAVMENAVAGVAGVFHQAALASVPLSLEKPLEVHRVCATGTLQLLDAARRAGTRRVIYAASSSAYGDQPFSSLRETDPPLPMSPYAAAKLAGEMYCRAFFHSFGLETVGLRYFNVYGPRQDPASPYSAVIPRFIAALLRGEPPVIFGDGRQTRDFTFVEDVVQGNLLAESAPSDRVAGKIFNLGSGRSHDLLTIADLLQRLTGVSLPPRHLPARPGDIRDSLADITLAWKQLGYSPRVDLETGLRQTVESFRA